LRPFCGHNDGLYWRNAHITAFPLFAIEHVGKCCNCFLLRGTSDGNAASMLQNAKAVLALFIYAAAILRALSAGVRIVPVISRRVRGKFADAPSFKTRSKVLKQWCNIDCSSG